MSSPFSGDNLPGHEGMVLGGHAGESTWEGPKVNKHTVGEHTTDTALPVEAF